MCTVWKKREEVENFVGRDQTRMYSSSGSSGGSWGQSPSDDDNDEADKNNKAAVATINLISEKKISLTKTTSSSVAAQLRRKNVDGFSRQSQKRLYSPERSTSESSRWRSSGDEGESDEGRCNEGRSDEDRSEEGSREKGESESTGKATKPIVESVDNSKSASLGVSGSFPQQALRAKRKIGATAHTTDSSPAPAVSTGSTGNEPRRIRVYSPMPPSSDSSSDFPHNSSDSDDTGTTNGTTTEPTTNGSDGSSPPVTSQNTTTKQCINATLANSSRASSADSPQDSSEGDETDAVKDTKKAMVQGVSVSSQQPRAQHLTTVHMRVHNEETIDRMHPAPDPMSVWLRSNRMTPELQHSFLQQQPLLQNSAPRQQMQGPLPLSSSLQSQQKGQQQGQQQDGHEQSSTITPSASSSSSAIAGLTEQVRSLITAVQSMQEQIVLERHRVDSVIEAFIILQERLPALPQPPAADISSSSSFSSSSSAAIENDPRAFDERAKRVDAARDTEVEIRERAVGVGVVLLRENAANRKGYGGSSA